MNARDDPNFDGIVTIAEAVGPVRSVQGPPTVAQYDFTTCPPLDVLVIPGGAGTREGIANPSLLDFIRKISTDTHPPLRHLLSVCTGAALLAAAGVLDGRKATTNKLAFSWVQSTGGRDISWQKTARFVVHGNITTAAGVSAGIDAALHLVMKDFGMEEAEAVARRAEYSGSFVDGLDDPFGILIS